jgi:2-polyprenyl-3-methyl-5-hydroxy-6-metoxy-1,4-benzoquinol methylase
LLAMAHPLDLERTGYSYIERPNMTLLDVLERHVVGKNPTARVVDVGCGAGATARALAKRHPQLEIHGVEPNARAAELVAEAGVQVFRGMLDEWIASRPPGKFDAVILGDVLEHIVDPIDILRKLVAFEGTRDATLIVSVPNYAVWYNRLLTLTGSFDYGWSGLYDRTHVRFFTRASLVKLLAYVGLEPLEVTASPSIVQSTAPLLRKHVFQRRVDAGEHLGLNESKAFELYSKFVEPLETAVCQAWPGLLGFQIVLAARRA